MKFVIATAVLGSLLLSATAWADVEVYRGINRRNATYAQVNNAQWRVDPDGVSTFENARFSAPQKPCRARFIILGVNAMPAPGIAGQIAFMPEGYRGVYTPEHGGEGHWSLQAPAGTDNDAFKLALTAYVIERHATEVNDTYNGGHPSHCASPEVPNALPTQKQ
ncbi:hypothetical protein [Parachitinimonas caeni]|uniref:Uncharacterized protein n=1 Tax=Parachitinimonas caeni TaxID=3031301 RepID=A0ABT7DTT2_9NEIS|nr:hypothetical protein [Parachitinimonas caeni]MDK2123374.1 hypothetical protein [Parachitinimonas caeni]